MFKKCQKIRKMKSKLIKKKSKPTTTRNKLTINTPMMKQTKMICHFKKEATIAKMKETTKI